MKKKFNLCCVAMLVALLFTLALPMVGTFATGFAQGWQNADKPEEKVEGVMTSVSLLPKVGPLTFTHEIYNEKTGENEKMLVLQAMVNSPSQDNAPLFHYGMPVMGALAVGVSIAFLVFFIKIILAVNRDEIFDQKMERRLSKCGWLLIAYYGIHMVICVGNYLYTQSLYEFKDYCVSIINYPNAAYLLAGIGMLLIGQIFCIARKLKEEQELTI